ncbi:heat shock factor protein 5 isoform X2 [Silurus meridionalis]|uniref:heat shock factor protein 5 isoform X2 n=1 Tax=Silurus meridionalis TaxID=175797 RepID=UPI001EEAB007|nr:heat shock factor protein 5 isoform X2 [Silurus meridionalis]
MEKEETCLLLIDPKHFPGKLWNLVNDPQIYSVCWDASGEGILIHQLPFKTEVLLAQTTQISKYFRTTDFASFIRQLNLYGFRKVPPDPPEKLHDNFSNLTQTHHFHNQNFKRDKPELLLHIKRLTAANKSKLAAGKQLPCKSSHSFYNAMPNLPLKISAVTKDSASVGHQGTFYHLSCNDLKQVKECDSTPKSPQRPAMNYVYEHCSPDFLDLKLPFSQPTVPYIPPFSYYSDCSVGNIHSSDTLKAGGVSGSWNHHLEVNLNPVYKVEDKMQNVGSLEIRDAAEARSVKESSLRDLI